MKEITDGLINDFHRRWTDKTMRHKIREWWRDGIWKPRWIIISLIILIFTASFFGAMYYDIINMFMGR